jgi:hypothetical protein
VQQYAHACAVCVCAAFLCVRAWLRACVQARASQILKMRSSKIQLETRMREEVPRTRAHTCARARCALRARAQVKQLRKMRREKEQEITSLKKAMVQPRRAAPRRC